MVTDLAIANELLERKEVFITHQQAQLEEKQAYIEEQQSQIEELTRKLHSTQQQLKALQHQPACCRQGGTTAQACVWPELREV